MLKVLYIGFDDTDSLKGSCTTYLATIIIYDIFDRVEFLDFPNLIRLNPNIPYKTRGNGAVALRISGHPKDLEDCREVVIKKVEELAEVDDENTNPGIAFVAESIPSKIKELSRKAMWDIIPLKEAEALGSLPNVDLHKFKLGRGIIGAMGAIGNTLEEDFTYEHLTYRSPENFGTKRLVDRESIIKADKATPLTFNNVDYEYNSIMITPRGADPVFAGIRGETVEEVMKAWSIVKAREKITMAMVFRTNQHTNQHFVKKFKMSELHPHLSVIVQGEISKDPYYIEGSHLIFSIKDETGEIDCAAYEPTKKFRGELKHLVLGDEVIVFGGVRPAEKTHPMTINVERLRVESLRALFEYENPFCDNCGARLKSAGKNKGYKCPKCSSVFREKKPIKKNRKRRISIKEYLPPIIAHRHLTKPLSREGKDNTGKEKSQKEVTAILKELVVHSPKHDPK